MSQQEIYNLLISMGIKPEDAKKMVAIAMAESGLNPHAVNDTRGKKLPAGYEQELSVGLFQINILAHYDDLTKEVESSSIDDIIEWLKNPVNNIRYAVKLYKSSGLSPWTTYKTGAYIKYLDKVNLQNTNPVMQQQDPVMQQSESADFTAWKPSSIWERAGMFIGGLVFITFGIYLLFNLIRGSGDNG